VCFRVDPGGGAAHGEVGSGTLEYASGGHPPAFLRGIDGRIDQLDSTTFVLGACAAGDFRPGEKAMPFLPGDTLIAYTDGALEARNINGRFLGIAGLQRILTTAKPTLTIGWPTTILKAVEQYRHGPTEDDTLVIEITRPLESGVFSNKKTGIATAAEAAAR
jgi:sigma-B regulation protein RsbU (phosphoserine phosphatase)